MSNLEWERNSRNAKNGNVSFVLKITLSDIAFFELPRAVTISTEETDEVGSTSPTNFHLSSCERRGQVECSTWINDHFADVFMSHLIRQCCAGSHDSSKERMCVSAPSNNRFEHICNAISYWNRRERASFHFSSRPSLRYSHEDVYKKFIWKMRLASWWKLRKFLARCSGSCETISRFFV